MKLNIQGGRLIMARKLTGIVLALILVMFFSYPTQAEIAATIDGKTGFSYMFKALNRSFNAQCNSALKPDQTVLMGLLSFENEKPTEATRLIEAKIDELKTYVESMGGALVLKERTRSVINAVASKKRRSDRHISVITSHKGSDDTKKSKPMFLTDQKFEAVFKSQENLKIDEVLEHFISLDVKYGSHTQAYGSYYNKPATVVAYRFSNPIEMLDKVHKKCREEAWKNWCKLNIEPAENNRCQKSFENFKQHFITTSFRLSSQPVLNAHGSQQALQIYYPWQEHQLKGILLFGDITLQLNGNISMRLQGPK